MRNNPTFTARDSDIVCVEDRRRSIRVAASGPVEFDVPEWCEARPFVGELVERSEHGIRLTHTCLRLERGMLISFRHAQVAGIARSVWNRRDGKVVESGFDVESWSGALRSKP